MLLGRTGSAIGYEWINDTVFDVLIYACQKIEKLLITVLTQTALSQLEKL